MYIKLEDGESYQDYITKILTSRKNEKEEGEYMERHHILPKSCGGDNSQENLIYLYPQEHYYCHKLLAIENEDNLSLQRAWWIMSHRNNVKITAEEYENAKLAFSRSISNTNHPMYGKTGELSPNYGRHLSDDTKEKISKSKQGENNPMYGKKGLLSPNYGKHLSEESKAKISKTKKSSYIKEQHPMYNKKHSEASKEKMSKAKLGKKIEDEQVLLKMSERMKGEKNPMYGVHLIGELNGFFGKKHSEETKRKISEANKGKYTLGNNPASVKVLCIETNEIYNSIKEAFLATGILSQNISKCCNGQRKTAGGFHWKKIEKEK